MTKHNDGGQSPVTREELEACARLLGYDATIYAGRHDNYVRILVAENDADLMALARAARLIVNYEDECVGTRSRRSDVLFFWFYQKDGTETRCILMACASVVLEREKSAQLAREEK